MERAASLIAVMPNQSSFQLVRDLQRVMVRIGLVTALTVWLVTPTARAQEVYELHLVLAFDVSASINDVEFALQRDGTARAFDHHSVRRAILEAPGGVAVSVIQWSSVGQQAMGLDWVVLRSTRDIDEMTEFVARMPRHLPGGGTMIHAGLNFAARQLDSAPGMARRQVIDLSGNGRADDLELLLEMRDRLVGDGVVINGLAVHEDFHDLDRYFYTNVIGGRGAFVMTAQSHDDFFEAMRRKLHREIGGAIYSDGALRRLAAQ